jgi:hypothetical protein
MGLVVLVAVLGCGSDKGAEHSPGGMAGSAGSDSGPPGPVCGDDRVDEGEECDGQPHCVDAACIWNPNWQCSTEPPYECHSGIADPDAELVNLTDAELQALCQWTQDVLYPVLGNGYQCAQGTIQFTPLDCQNAPGSFVTRGTVAGCHMTVAELEACTGMHELSTCEAFFVGVPECRLELCRYAEPGTPCTEAAECESNICCAQAGTDEKFCSAEACPGGAHLDPCTTDDFCAPGTCVDGRCLVQPGLAGAECFGNDWCLGGTCHRGVCKGNSTTFCDEDYECESTRLCCGGDCGALDSGCPGRVGSACDISCLEGMCAGNYFCTQECTEETDCGSNPWGFTNHCTPTWAGTNSCFSGCATDDDCQENLGEPSARCFEVEAVEPDTPGRKVCSLPNGYAPDSAVAYGH